MARKKKAKYKVRGRRMLLNPPGYQSTAAIVAEVEDTREWEPTKNREGDLINTIWQVEPEYTLEISDCTRKISLELDWKTPGERRAALAKIDRMIGALTEFREAVVDEQRLYLGRQRFAQRKRNKTTA